MMLEVAPGTQAHKPVTSVALYSKKVAQKLVKENRFTDSLARIGKREVTLYFPLSFKQKHNRVEQMKLK